MNPSLPTQNPFPYQIFWKEYKIRDDFSGRLVTISGWSHNNHEEAEEGYCNPVGIFDSYTSAMADAMGLWEEYCDFHREKRNVAK